MLNVVNVPLTEGRTNPVIGSLNVDGAFSGLPLRNILSECFTDHVQYKVSANKENC